MPGARKRKKIKERFRSATISAPADKASLEKLEENVIKKCDELANAYRTATSAKRNSRNDTEILDVEVVSADSSVINYSVDTVKTTSTADKRASTAVAITNSNSNTNIQKEVVKSDFDAFKHIPTAKSVAAAAAVRSIPVKYASVSFQSLKPFCSSQNAERRIYNRDKLLSLREVSASTIRPSNKIVQRIEQFYQQQTIGNTNIRNQQPKPSQQQHKRSIQNAQRDGGQDGQHQQQNNHGSKPGMIQISLSLREDVKLNATENAWKPTFHSSQNNNITELLYKRVRGILNKLTPEKFDTLLEQMTGLNIDTMEQLNDVIVLVFEKAIDEPNYANAYALLCQKLSSKWLMDDVNRMPGSERPYGSETEKNNTQGHAEEVNQQAQFKKSLITKCQIEFTNHVDNDEAIVEILAPYRQNIKEATDFDLCAEYMTVLDEEERRLRRRAVGTVKFIGELYKMNMLTLKIMYWCVDTLLRKEIEYKLECLCKLLTTVGLKMEFEAEDLMQFNLSEHFKKMQSIVKRHKVSSRVRFMLQDVIELRKSNWTLRHNDLNPKTMREIQREAEKEQKQIHFLNYAKPGSVRNDDRGSGGKRSDYYIGGRVDGGGYSQNKSRGGLGGSSSGGYLDETRRSNSIPVDQSKLRSKLVSY